jgi:hypothetical protein
MGADNVAVTIAANSESAARTAILNVAGEETVLTQEGAARVISQEGTAQSGGVARRSIDLPGAVYGTALGLAGSVAGSTTVRIETRLHNWSLTSGNSSATAGLNGFLLAWDRGQANVLCRAPYDGGAYGNIVRIPVGGRADFVVRCQRDVPNGRITGEVWNADGSDYRVYTLAITRWATTLNASTIVLGRWSWETPNAEFRMGFLRLATTIKALGGPPVEGDQPGNIANYEFEDTTSDTSGNNRHLRINVTPAFFNTN